ncbi:MAG TPA: CcmD family protein [Candidatus Latescibacteria bacterium]|nr:MAG: hypothetical protein BWY06_00754 [Candidatus Latescibacteria bacterium ADurb.Bin168]HPU86101.1 CcmD family protein [Candidatus Latescibacterota bacterium]
MENHACARLRPAFVFLVLFSCILFASGQAWAGDTLVGDVSPWKNAHFVVAAYGAVWLGAVLYILHLLRRIGALERDIARLRAERERVSS